MFMCGPMFPHGPKYQFHGTATRSFGKIVSVGLYPFIGYLFLSVLRVPIHELSCSHSQCVFECAICFDPR